MQARSTLLVAAAFVAGVVVGTAFDSRSAVRAQAGGRVYELRTYTSPEGKLTDLERRFRDHTIRIFKNHGMESIGYWTPQDAPESQNTLIYILAHPSREAAKKNWAEFQADPEWQKVNKDSNANGPILSKVVSVFLDPTDFSPMK